MPLRVTTLLAALIALAATAAPASAAPHLTPVGSFTTPVYVTAPPADPHRLYVVEQAGRIMEVLDGRKLDTPFLDITRDVKSGGEQGLLSMAFAPDYATSGRFYVYYTAPRAGDSTGSVITVREFRHAAGNLDLADPGSGRTVYTVDHPTNSNHNGGQLQFGPDGLLYAGTGDGGSGNDPPNNAQNPAVRLGKLLRVNPLSADAANPEIYALGLRNPFRFSFDRQTGELTIGDVGQNAYEEIDFAPARAPAGANYGWVCYEGFHKNGTRCDVPTRVDPVLEKAHSTTGYCAIIGGYVVRDPAIPELNGRYVYGDNCADGIRSVALARPRATDDSDTGMSVSGLTSFGEDSCGHVYASSGGGPVYRIDGDTFTPCPGPPPPPAPPAPPAADTRAPVVRIGVRRKQHALRQRGVRLKMSCDEVCAAAASGVIRIAGSKHVYVLKPALKQLAANSSLRVRLKMSKRARRALRSAFRRHRRVTTRLTVVGRDGAGNASAANRRARLVP
jgi:glucose/arabinose dehydrogenase